MPTTQELRNRAENRRLATLRSLKAATQAQLGQHFTPVETAELMASFVDLPATGTLRILDPGAGAGILSAALVAHVLDTAPQVAIELVAVETDASLVPLLNETLAECENAARLCGTPLGYTIIAADFIDALTGIFNRPSPLDEPFDIAIMNPPYGKLAANSMHRRALARNGLGCPNLYAAFLALSVASLRRGGQVVAITPRSFANGPYFGEFRRTFLGAVALNNIHTYQSRSAVFSDSGVLQETVIIRATKGSVADQVTLSVSADHRSVSSVREVPYSDVVHPEDPHQFIRIVGDADEQAAIDTLTAIPGRLHDLGIAVSTGRVVDFRARAYLQDEPTSDCAPLVYPGNFVSGVVTWPRNIRKPQGFRLADDFSAKQVVPNGTYVLAKRFSAREERRRIVAAIWDHSAPDRAAIAFENHLNVFHLDGRGIDRNLALGLSYWLNSSLIDRFFRTFSGHTQVNATDLRTLPYPTRNQLISLGEHSRPALPNQDEIDTLVHSSLAV